MNERPAARRVPTARETSARFRSAAGPPRARTVTGMDLGVGDSFTATVIHCDRSRPGPRCKCGTRAEVVCSFELYGPKAGKTCGARLCGRCCVEGMCAPHYRYVEARRPPRLRRHKDPVILDSPRCAAGPRPPIGPS